MDRDPSDEELRTFVAAMLSNLDKELREPEVIDEAIREHRPLWVRIYLASLDFEVHEATS